MKKALSLVILLVLCAFLLSGCSFAVKNLYKVRPVTLSNNYKTASWMDADSTELKSIVLDNLSFSGDDDGVVIKILHSETSMVEATYSEELDDYGFKVSFSKGQIKISVDKPRTFITKKFVLTVYANFDKVVVSGGLPLSIDASGVQDLSVDISGGVEANIYGVNAATAEIDVSGAAEINISGTAENFLLELSGAGELEGKYLLCKNADIEISGAGEASISVTDVLSVDISGVGEVEYYGSPVVINDLSGIADIDQKSPEPFVSYSSAF